MRRYVLLFVFMVILASSFSIGKTIYGGPDIAFAASDYYVDNASVVGCQNSHSYGSESNPWCTITYAVNHISPGDTVYVKAGTYNENLSISGLVGNENAVTQIKAYPGHEVILRGNGINTGRVKITESSYLTFEGFGITNYNQGIFIEGGSDHITIRNCTIFAVGQEAIHIRQNSSYILIEGNTIYDTDLYIHNGEGLYIGTGSAGPKDNTHHVTVRNNLIHDVGDEGIELKPGTHDCLIEGNIVYNAVVGRTWGAIEVGESVLGAQEWPADPNHVIRNNIVHDVMTGIRAGTGSLVYNNVIYDVEGYGIYINNRASDSYLRRIYHNTVDTSSPNAIYVAGGLTDIRNNIGPSSVNNIPPNNVFFVNTAEGEEDYHLVNGAAPIDAGVDLTDVVAADLDGTARPYGSAPDIGAYEYAPGSQLEGDVNGDGQVDQEDIQACVNHVLGVEDWGASADINGDGGVNILDVQQVVNITSD
jgi:archaellum component FlaG (FlaF/FlaG flagellin family)